MPSSISNSEPIAAGADPGGRGQPDLRRAAVLLLTGAVLLGLALEFVASAMVYRMSPNMQRVQAETEAAYRIGHDASQPRHVLLAGNSLLREGVDMDALQKGMPEGWVSSRYGVPQTTYFEWYYGLRKLIAKGSHPDIIVLCLEPRHLIAPGIQRPEIFAHYMLQLRDIVAAGLATDMHPTDIADMVAAHASTFYALRKEIRKGILAKLIPDLQHVTALLASSGVRLPDDATLRSIARERLGMLEKETSAAGIRLVLLLPPPTHVEHIRLLREVGEETGVPVLVAGDYEALQPDDYQADKYHLSDSGKQKFTAALIPAIDAQLQQHADAPAKAAH